MTNENADSLTDGELDGDGDQDLGNAGQNTPDPFEVRLAQLEAVNNMTQRQVAALTAAVGRAQSLADKFEKTGDPKVEEKVRAAMAEVYDVLGVVSDNIDPAILPDAAKQRVASAREATRRAAEQAELDRRVQAALDERAPRPVSQTPAPDNDYAQVVEARVVAKITAKGLDPDDPTFNWAHAARLLKAEGEAAVNAYFDEQISKMSGDGEPRRRPRGASPAPAGVSAEPKIEDLLNTYAEDPRKLKPADRATVEKYMLGAGVMR